MGIRAARADPRPAIVEHLRGTTLPSGERRPVLETGTGLTQPRGDSTLDVERPTSYSAE